MAALCPGTVMPPVIAALMITFSTPPPFAAGSLYEVPRTIVGRTTDRRKRRRTMHAGKPF
jgi:hypothetical protein